MYTEHNPSEGITIIESDCREYLDSIDKDSIHLMITDPPYFLDGLDNKWSKGNKIEKEGVISGLPSGMKFDPKQGIKLQSFMSNVSKKCMRVLKPGAFAIIFSQPRLVHRMAISFEDSGFEIRDVYAWHFMNQSQAKAFSMDHFVEKMKISEIEKNNIIDKLGGRKTAQLRPQFELMILAQKPRIGTFVENWIEYETGLIDVSRESHGQMPSSLMCYEKPNHSDIYNHPTIKPFNLIRYLMKIFSKDNQVVLDPFLGSGTTAEVAKSLNRKCIGIEINPKYVKMSLDRVSYNEEFFGGK